MSDGEREHRNATRYRQGQNENEQSALQIARDALQIILNNINTTSRLDFSQSDDDTNSPTLSSVTLERGYPYNIHDYSLLALNQNTTMSRDNNADMSNGPINATLGVLPETIDDEIQQLKEAYDRHSIIIGGPPLTSINNTASDNLTLQELLREIRELRVQVNNQGRTGPVHVIGHGRTSHGLPAIDLTNIHTSHDVRRQPGTTINFLTLKEARNMIPEIDGASRNRVREFINASSYAIKNIHPVDESTLLEAILCTKFRGKAMLDFHTRDIANYS
ncbi:hypothetical protein ALC62_02267 [Cyphomyrmex costatus]|uniref:Uncharacterized protein n=1 Tax=Cyphomyrmex costatus TaxID=456900 RepID=A0A151IN73_9HYME|nr:hypothetical protein ALC62_02267 [Cyphomyrmex costatus]